ncbi:C45 family peptidase [Autumnicola musiva]|uniref:C45 family peptidase n=1 Tax=Autumnicola musiva TaxID=3075589 RepID=A0ABU3D748_9FLAO|nr:C45 family peptidase [Zunongwangia sp. F117]MDT0677342.1 C45 family peptidase [Zunongwangia sp. F117]
MANFIKNIFLFVSLLQLVGCGVKKSMADRPDISGIETIDTVRTAHDSTHFSLGNNNLIKNKYGIWELYIEGNALERGLANGSLTQDLIHKQENAFMGKIDELVPSQTYQSFLKKMISWFNRKMYLHVTEEYKEEIYGVSRFGLKKYDEFAPAYVRMLYFHGAHDIGHALKDLMLVGCTSFAAWDKKTADGELLLGRNFDFYAGDEFSEEKIVSFVNPDSGYKFMSYSWGGMIGVVSGMNEKGVSVTINAGKSKIPLIAKTPVTLVAREILQYAANTNEAIEIAKKREVFVSEAIMVGSAEERKAILIEVSPKNFGVYEVENQDELVCSNHFQSEAYAEDQRNLKTIEESHSAYRYERMQELLEEKNKLTPEKAAAVLRNKNGLHGENIGYGNEKAINQLLAHHGIIFKPEENQVWISANPYQLGAFVAYDLDEVFARFEQGNVEKSVANAEKTIPEDEFVHSENFKKYEEFRKLSYEVFNAISAEETISEDKIQHLKQLNPHFWKAYYLAGAYYFQQKDYKKAIIDLKQAKRREISSVPEEEEVEKLLKQSYRKI